MSTNAVSSLLAALLGMSHGAAALALKWEGNMHGACVSAAACGLFLLVAVVRASRA